MSVRSVLLTAYFRRYVKPLAVGRSFDDILAVSNSVADKPRRLPKNTRLEHLAVGNIPVERISGRRHGSRTAILYFHGGGYCTLSAKAFRHVTGQLAIQTGARVFAHDYRLAPLHPFPAAVEDSVTVYTWLLASGYPPGNIVAAGDSAGGGLALATLLMLRERQLPLPAGLALMSPWADLTQASPENRPNAERDPLLHCAMMNTVAPRYHGDVPAEDPFVSPVYADFTGFPPTFIHAGSTEILLSDAEKLAAGMREAGVAVTLRVWKNMPHVWHTLDILPEAGRGVREIAAFCRTCLDAPGTRRDSSPTADGAIS
jgi:acetyl esterase/lipase